MISPNDILGTHAQPAHDPSYESFLTPLPNLPGVRGAKNVLKALKTAAADIYRRFIPKVYCRTEQFHDWRTPRLVSMMAYFAAKQNKETIEQYQAYINLISFSLQWAEYKTPTFFVSAELLSAVQASGLPKDFDFNDLKLPFPSMVFMFPKGSRPLTLGGKEVQYVGLSQMTDSISTSLGEVQTNRQINKLIVTTAFYPTAFIACSFRGSRMNEIVAMDTSAYIEQCHNPRNGVRGDENEALLTHDLLKLALACVLVMEARPELIEMERRISVTQKRNEVRSVWSPNILGRRYAIRRTGEATGTHASPRSHWRRGHFRRQGIGYRTSYCVCEHPRAAHRTFCEIAECSCGDYRPQGFKEYKTIWIEPMLIAGKLTAAG